MTWHPLMQFASLAGEGQRAHRMAVDDFFFFFKILIFSFSPSSLQGFFWAMKEDCLHYRCVTWSKQKEAKINLIEAFWDTNTAPGLKFHFPSYLDLIGRTMIMQNPPPVPLYTTHMSSVFCMWGHSLNSLIPYKHPMRTRTRTRLSGCSPPSRTLVHPSRTPMSPCNDIY